MMTGKENMDKLIDGLESIGDSIDRCENCQRFERGHWLPEYGGGEQSGGNCKALCKVLGMTNSHLVWHDALYVQESFGCSLFTPNANRQMTKGNEE